LTVAAVDTDLVERAFDQYADMVLRIAYQNTRNQSDAEDIAQNVFIQLMRAGNFADEVHMKAWLIRVTINQCKNLKASAWYRKTTYLKEEWLPFTAEQNKVFEELWRLSTDQRNVIYLYFYEGYNAREIGELLCRNESTVSSLLNRGKRKLKQLFIEGGYPYE